MSPEKLIPLRPFPEVQSVDDPTQLIPQYGAAFELFSDVMATPQNPNGIPDGFMLAFATPKDGRTFHEVGEEYSRVRGKVDAQEFFSRTMQISENSYMHVPNAPEGMPIETYCNIMAREVLRREMKNEGSQLGTPYLADVPGNRFNLQFPGDNGPNVRGKVACNDIEGALDTLDNDAMFVLKYGFPPNFNLKSSLGRTQRPELSYSIEAIASLYGDEALVHYQKPLAKYIQFMEAGRENLANVPLGSHAAYRRVARMPNGLDGHRYWDDTPVNYETKAGLRVEMAAYDLEMIERMLHGLEIEEKQIKYYKFTKSVMAGCESTQDHASKHFADYFNIETIRTIDIFPADLNANMVHMHRTLARSYEVTGDLLAAQHHYRRAQDLATIIRTYCYRETDETHAQIHDVLFDGTPTDAINATMAYPLLAGDIFTYEEKVKIARTWKEKLLHDESGFMTSTVWDSPEHWDGFNVWPSINLRLVDAFVHAATEAVAEGKDPGLFLEIAEQARVGFLSALNSWYETNRNIPERLHAPNPKLYVAKGEYGTQSGKTDEEGKPQIGFGMTIGSFRALVGRNLRAEVHYPKEYSWRRHEYSTIGNSAIRRLL